eukprot:902548-Rhodomonas_salina.2
MRGKDVLAFSVATGRLPVGGLGARGSRYCGASALGGVRSLSVSEVAIRVSSLGSHEAACSVSNSESGSPLVLGWLDSVTVTVGSRVNSSTEKPLQPFSFCLTLRVRLRSQSNPSPRLLPHVESSTEEPLALQPFSYKFYLTSHVERAHLRQHPEREVEQGKAWPRTLYWTAKSYTFNGIIISVARLVAIITHIMTR